MIGITIDDVEIEAGITKEGIIFRFVLPKNQIEEYMLHNKVIIGVPVDFLIDLLNQFDGYDEFSNVCVAEIDTIADVKGYGKTLFIKFPLSCSRVDYGDDKVVYTVIITWLTLTSKLLEVL